MENEDFFRAKPEDENENSQHESVADVLKNEIISILKKDGFSEDYYRKITEWKNLKGINQINQTNDMDGFVNLTIEEVEIIAEAGYIDEAIDQLDSLLITAKKNDYFDTQRIEDFLEKLENKNYE